MLAEVQNVGKMVAAAGGQTVGFKEIFQVAGYGFQVVCLQKQVENIPDANGLIGGID